jgi:hypothetical protein
VNTQQLAQFACRDDRRRISSTRSSTFSFLNDHLQRNSLGSGLNNKLAAHRSGALAIDDRGCLYAWGTVHTSVAAANFSSNTSSTGKSLTPAQLADKTRWVQPQSLAWNQADANRRFKIVAASPSAKSSNLAGIASTMSASKFSSHSNASSALASSGHGYAAAVSQKGDVFVWGSLSAGADFATALLNDAVTGLPRRIEAFRPSVSQPRITIRSIIPSSPSRIYFLSDRGAMWFLGEPLEDTAIPAHLTTSTQQLPSLQLAPSSSSSDANLATAASSLAPRRVDYLHSKGIEVENAAAGLFHLSVLTKTGMGALILTMLKTATILKSKNIVMYLFPFQVMYCNMTLVIDTFLE